MRAFLALGSAGALVAAAACLASAGEPLGCMKRFKMKDFVIGSWAFHTTAGYDEEFCRTYMAAGFNTIIHCLVNLPRDKQPPKEDYWTAALDAADRAGLNVIMHTARPYGPWGAWEGVEFPEKYGDRKGGYVVLPGLKWLHAKYGAHRSLVGYLLDDDSAVRWYTIENAKWLEKTAPGMLPYLSENLDPKKQAGAPMPVLGTQNYPWRRRGWPERRKRGMYCNFLHADRTFSNENNMAFWTIFLTTHRRGSSPSQLRFQAFMPLAYGAQGIWWFAYSTRDARWRPGGEIYRIAKYCNEYLADVVGPRVIGCRSAAIYHQPEWKRCETPGEGKVIERMDEDLRAGLLLPEKDFKAGAKVPRYVMLVDYRTADPGEELPRRTVRVKFGPVVRSVGVLGREMIGKGNARPKVVRGREVELALKAGDGILLEINPE